MDIKVFKLPDLGEGLQEAEIVEWHVKEGDIIKVDQSLVSMETAKAIVEVPSPYAGKIKKLYGKSNDIIKTGESLVEFEDSEGENREYESKHEHKHENEREQEQKQKQKIKEDSGTVAGKLEVEDTIISEKVVSKSNAPISSKTTSKVIKASPAVRAVAEQLKIDLTKITPTGPGQTITLQDVQKAAEVLEASEAPQVTQASQISSQKGKTTISGVAKTLGPTEPLKGVRRFMAQTMSQAHQEIVPVTILEDAKLLNWSKNEDITVRIIQAMVVACQKEPSLNAWYDGEAVARRLFQSIHLGLAMDTNEGLFVPVIKDVESMQREAIRKKIDKLKVQVQSRTIPAEELRGGTITLSNFGKFAGKYANPIIVPPMVAILGTGKLREEVIANEGNSVVCNVLPLSLTFDHRVVSGGEATRFLGILIEELEKKT